MIHDVDYELLSVMKTICCTLSILGSVFVITSHLTIKGLQSVSFRLIALLQSSSLIYCLAELINYESGPQNLNSIQCRLQGTLINYGLTSQFMWTILIAQHMHNMVVKNNDTQPVIFQIALGVALPLCISILPLFFDGYGPALISCWINKDDMIYEMIIFYLIFSAAFFLNVIYYLATWRFLKAIFDNESFIKLAIYPIILFVCWIWSAVNQFVQFYDHYQGWLTIFSITFQGLAGFCYFIAYCMTPQVKIIIFDKCLKKKELPDHSQEMSTRIKRSQTFTQSPLVIDVPVKKPKQVRSNSVSAMSIHTSTIQEEQSNSPQSKDQISEEDLHFDKLSSVMGL